MTRRLLGSLGPALGLLFGLLLSGAAPARADDDAARTQAGALFEQGIARVEAGRFLEAALAFDEAYALSGNPVVLYNAGMAYAAAERPVEAVRALERALSEAELTPEQRRRADAELVRQRARSSVDAGGAARSQGPEGAAAPGPALSEPTSQVVAAVALPEAPRAIDAPAPWLRTGYGLYAVGVASGVAALSVYLVGGAHNDDWHTEQTRIDDRVARADAVPYDASVYDALARRQRDNDARAHDITRLDHWALGLGIAAGGLVVAGAVCHLIGWRRAAGRVVATSTRVGLSLAF